MDAHFVISPGSRTQLGKGKYKYPYDLFFPSIVDLIELIRPVVTQTGVRRRSEQFPTTPPLDPLLNNSRQGRGEIF